MKSRGFSLVELLVVIVVLVLLATMTGFLVSNWRDNTATNEVKSDLTNAVTAVESYNNYNSFYPPSQTVFSGLYTNSESVDLTYARRFNGSFCINAVSNIRTSVAWHVDSAVGKSPRLGSCS